jgi:CheB methylesterase
MVKVLIIGGSTSNDGDYENLFSTLIDPNNIFLKEWAVIISIHNFWLLEDITMPGKYVEAPPVQFNAENNNRQRSELWEFNENQNIVIIENNGRFIIKNGNIYILAGSLKNPVNFDVFEEKKVLYLEAKFAEIVTIKSKNVINSPEDESFLPEDEYENYPFENLISLARSSNTNNNTDENNTDENITAGYYPNINEVMERFLANYDNLQDLAGVVLAGFDDDGAEGLLAMKRNGCKTAVQNPEECDNGRNSEMPQNALDAAREQSSGHDIITLGTAEFPTFVEWFSNLNNNT